MGRRILCICSIVEFYLKIGECYKSVKLFSTLEKKHGIKAHFHCVGPLYRELRVKMEILPFYDSIKERLHFYGRKKLRDSFKIGENCGIGLSIIHPMSNSIESYPTKIFEYMATGMPTIASDFKLYKSIVEEVNCGA